MNSTYFIHSNYLSGIVMIEKTNDSEAFYSSKYYISKISSNSRLINKWLINEEFKIFTSKK